VAAWRKITSGEASSRREVGNSARRWIIRGNSRIRINRLNDGGDLLLAVRVCYRQKVERAL
jgi:hypothetical protein